MRQLSDPVSSTEIGDDSVDSVTRYNVPRDPEWRTVPDPYAAASRAPRWLRPFLPSDPEARSRLRLIVLRLVIAVDLLLGVYYLSWRFLYSINWAYWPLALALLIAETYSYIDAWLFGLTMWRSRRRPPPAPGAGTVDVFITCYNEPVELVRRTARAARHIRRPHRTYVLDDGDAAGMRAMAQEEGIGYLIRSSEWQGHARHAKAGNLINALYQTDGEFLLILDADQIPAPEILDRVLGYFHDPKVALVQTPQWFYNVPPGDPFGSQAPLFYGPIQEGKDGWNAAFFCGSNAVLRREALMQLGLATYVRELEERVRRALRTADCLLRRSGRRLAAGDDARARVGLRELHTAVRAARHALRVGVPIQEVTWTFQRSAEGVSRLLVADDLAFIRAELADIPGLDTTDLDTGLADIIKDEGALAALAGRSTSPLAAVAAMRGLLLGVDVDRSDEAHPVLPMATISITEDMATAMRLHALGWRSVYHHEVLAVGLAPEDLASSLKQRLRWAQGTIQVFLRENPLLQRGLALMQRLMYFATMWSYLSGFIAIIYLLSPILYLFFGWVPLRSYSVDFFAHLLPYLAVNELLFVIVGWGLPIRRGRQYSLALFPLWITAVTSVIGNVYFGRKLGFVVTPKTRQAGVSLSVVRWQIAMMALLTGAIVYGVARVLAGSTAHWFSVLVNVFWSCYDLAMLGVVLGAVRYTPATSGESPMPTMSGTAAEAHGRP